MHGNNGIKKSFMDQCPQDIQHCIFHLASINYPSISIQCAQVQDTQYPFGEITFSVKDMDESSLGTFIGIYDHDYKRMDIHRFSRTEYHIENEGEFVDKALGKVIDFIFDFQDKNYSTIRIDNKLHTDYQAYTVADHDHDSYYLFRNTTQNPLYTNLSANSCECTIKILNSHNFVSNEQHMDIDGDDSILVFTRRCVIQQIHGIDSDKMKIVLDLPIILTAPGYPCDVCFKLKIEDTDITARDSVFQAQEDVIEDWPWDFRLGKYAKEENVLHYYIDRRQVVVYHYFETRRCRFNYGYNIFEDNIQTNFESKIIHVND
eukprot:598832_1